MLAACGDRSEPATSAVEQAQRSRATEAAAASPAARPAATATVATVAREQAARAKATATTPADEGAVAAKPTATPAAEASQATEASGDAAQDLSGAVPIVLSGSSVQGDGAGVTVDGSKVLITSAGAYSISGALRDGQILVDTNDEETVTLILNGADIHSSTSAPIYIADAEKVVIVLADGTENRVSDEDSYILGDPESDEPNAAIFSKADLTLSGSGSLAVSANYNDGIAGKDDLTIAGGAITVKSVDDGIRGKDRVIIRDGAITVEAGGDGLKSDNENDPEKGMIRIEGGRLDVTSGGDAIEAETGVTVTAGEITLTSGGGSRGRIEESASAKGIKGAASVTIAGGTFTISSADDAIHSNGSIAIGGGAFDLASGDDAMHADATLEINAGDIRITNSYEGLESAVITVNDGEIHIVSSDDGINVVGGNDGSGMNRGPGRGGGMGGRPGQDGFAYSGDQHLRVNGGYIAIDADGDGLDINGAIEMTDGVVIVHGPTSNVNGALDHTGFKITGGFLVAAGSAGMAQAPDTSSTQVSVLLNFNSPLEAGTLFHLRGSDGAALLTFEPAKPYQSIAFSSAELADGATYDVYLGGSSSGAAVDGLNTGGAYTPGALAGSFTTSGITTQIGRGRR
jgi:hypothetical protein